MSVHITRKTTAGQLEFDLGQACYWAITSSLPLTLSPPSTIDTSPHSRILIPHPPFYTTKISQHPFHSQRFSFVLSFSLTSILLLYFLTRFSSTFCVTIRGQYYHLLPNHYYFLWHVQYSFLECLQMQTTSKADLCSRNSHMIPQHLTLNEDHILSSRVFPHLKNDSPLSPFTRSTVMGSQNSR